ASRALALNEIGVRSIGSVWIDSIRSARLFGKTRIVTERAGGQFDLPVQRRSTSVHGTDERSGPAPHHAHPQGPEVLRRRFAFQLHAIHPLEAPPSRTTPLLLPPRYAIESRECAFDINKHRLRQNCRVVQPGLTIEDARRDRYFRV